MKTVHRCALALCCSLTARTCTLFLTSVCVFWLGGCVAERSLSRSTNTEKSLSGNFLEWFDVEAFLLMPFCSLLSASGEKIIQRFIQIIYLYVSLIGCSIDRLSL